MVQAGLAPLLADAAAAARLATLPDPVREAAARLLAFRLPTDAPVTPDALAKALRRSGLFLEADLAAGRGLGRGLGGTPGGATPGAGPAASELPMPDLKAALMALKAALAGAAGATDDGTAQASAAAGRPAAAAAGTPAGAPTGPLPGSPEAGAQALYRAIAQALTGGAPTGGAPTAGASSGAASPPHAPGPVPGQFSAEGQGLFSQAAGAAPRTGPPPPYAGSAPSAQPPVPPAIDDATPLKTVLRMLAADTDGALARHTLLQVASVPDRAQASGQADGPARWAFEVPFATPHGTTVAQFEISRDGKHAAGEKQEAVWRARFAIDLEPLGVIDAQVALTGTRAAVTLWAERDAGAASLRDHAAELAEALRGAELEPEVTVRDGAPPRPRAAPAGRFLDRAS
ncbi:hypothetical protein A33M_1764 [Rhodovulum sp. PH10]|nr:hypothetical protein A33M_1764 [Rhodovulum sp. PH10]